MKKKRLTILFPRAFRFRQETAKEQNGTEWTSERIAIRDNDFSRAGYLNDRVEATTTRKEINYLNQD